MNKITVAFGCLILGAAVVVLPVALSPSIAAYASQRIYDCGIRVAPGVSGAMISGANISGHTYGICVDAGANDTTITRNAVTK
jgi:nitrous oxidase accessory protein NosD